MAEKAYNSYEEKALPEDADSVVFWSEVDSKNKKFKMSGLFNFFLDKLATAVTAKLKTSNKTVIGAINELNSNCIYVEDATNWNPKNEGILLKKCKNLIMSTNAVEQISNGAVSGAFTGIISYLGSGTYGTYDICGIVGAGKNGNHIVYFRYSNGVNGFTVLV